MKKVRRNGRVFKSSYKSPSWYKPRGYKQDHTNNNNFRTGVSNYRKRALQSQGKKCRVCKKSKPAKQLEIHHKDTQGKRRYSNNHKLKNLSVVCKSCHRKYLQGRKKK